MKLRNEIFAKVLDWLIKEKKVADQKDLSMKTGISQNTVSRIMTGKVEPSDDTLRRLNAAFGNIFSMQYLRGESSVAFLEDVVYYKANPDELRNLLGDEVEEKRIDQSSLVNAALAAKDESITQLKQRLLDKEEIIQSLRDQLSTKDQLIAEQKARLIEYRHLIDSRDLANNYPFPIGVADENHKQKRL